MTGAPPIGNAAEQPWTISLEQIPERAPCARNSTHPCGAHGRVWERQMRRPQAFEFAVATIGFSGRLRARMNPELREELVDVSEATTLIDEAHKQFGIEREHVCRVYS